LSVKKLSYQNTAPVGTGLFCVGWLGNVQRFITLQNHCTTHYSKPLFYDVFATVVVCIRTLLPWSTKNHNGDLSVICLPLYLRFKPWSYRNIPSEVNCAACRFPDWKNLYPAFAHGLFRKFRPNSRSDGNLPNLRRKCLSGTCEYFDWKLTMSDIVSNRDYFNHNLKFLLQNGISVYITNMWIKQLCGNKVRDFAMAF